MTVPKVWQPEIANWQLAMIRSEVIIVKKPDFAADDDQDFDNQKLLFNNWHKPHFQALLKPLPCSNSDHGVMRAQMAVIQHALKRWETNKVTAPWIEDKRWNSIM